MILMQSLFPSTQAAVGAADMKTSTRAVAIGALLLTALGRSNACEPVLPFVESVVPALALSGSFLVLIAAVMAKSVLFTFFEPRIPRLKAGWRMFLGNVLTSLVGILVAGMIGSGPGAWALGVPLVCVLCWLPSRRLVQSAPLKWLSQLSPLGVAGIMTTALLGSCVLFGISRGAIDTHQLMLYWAIKVCAIFLALLASVTLTTIWEEWAIWRLSSRPEGTQYFVSVLRSNLYVLVLVLAVPAAVILPKRLKSHDFLAKRTAPSVEQTAPLSGSGMK